MNDFKGLARGMATVKTSEQMWQYARNILLTNKYTSVTNEKGNEYGYSIPGVVIGFVVANEDIVYYSVDGDYTCIGYVNYIGQVYVPVIRTTDPRFKFNKNSPIEGVYVYNYKKELITVFSDGVNNNSNSPKLINVHNPQVALSAAKEFINADDYTMFELFSYIELPSSNISYEPGSLNAEVVHIAFCYVFEDNTDSLYSPIIDSAYPNFKGDNTKKRNVVIELTNLSKKFSKIKLAFIIKREAGDFAYTTPVLSITNDKLVYTLSSEEDLTVATPDEIVILPERFTKIKSITKTANQIEIANVEQRSRLDFQKYANKLILKSTLISTTTTLDEVVSNPTLLPDEVYAFSIIPIFLDSTKGDAFHIPGRLPEGTETTILDTAGLAYYGLDYPKYTNKGYKQFHLSNTGSVAADGAVRFGYWQNENTYPNKDRYNSTDVGGTDLRGTPIRYHRFPAPDTFPVTMNGKAVNKVKIGDIVSEDLARVPRFGIEITNFDSVVPADIKAQLQGYEIVFEKRSRGGSYIDATGVLYKAIIQKGVRIKVWAQEVERFVTADSNQDFKDFSMSTFISPEVLKDKPAINADIVKVYYPLSHIRYIDDSDTYTGNRNRSGANTPTLATPYERIASIDEAKYLLANNISSNNRYSPERLQLKLRHKSAGDLSDSFIPISNGNSTINCLVVALITLNKNIYNLENNNDFISMGIVLFNKTNEKLINGDVFVNNVIRSIVPMREKFVFANDGVEFGAYKLQDYYFYNIYSPISNHFITNGKSGVIPENHYNDRNAEDLNVLNGVDYNTTIKSKNINNYFNTYTGAVPPALTDNYVTYFPYRIYKGLAIPNESLQTKNLRFFPTNSYYDMRNDRGDIVAIRGYNRGLYIQQRYSLFQTSIADKLNATAEETYLGSSELFDRIPEEIMYNDNIGYVGSNSQFACIVTKDGYATVDEERGKVFIVGEGMEEISQQYLKNYFQKALPLGDKYMKKDLLNKDVKVDNPYVSIGYLLGIDEANNRLILTKKYYAPKPTTNGLSFDGEFFKDTLGNILDFNDAYYFKNESLTYSYALDSKTWVAPHDYHPNAYLHNSRGFYGIENKKGTAAKLYKFNSNNVNPGNYFGKQYESYVDLIHNTRLDINKQYQAIYWVTEAVDMTTERILQFDTIDKVMLYSNHQCSGIIPVSKTSLGNARNVEGIWQLNEFRDMMKSPDYKILDEDGNLISDGLLTQKQWFTKGLFIGNFIVTRFIWTNQTKVLKHIHNVNVKSITSNR